MPRRARRRPGPTVHATAARDAARHARGVISRDARSIADELLAAPIAARRVALRDMTDREQAFVFAEVAKVQGTVYGLWWDAPSAFAEDVCGDTIWSKQRAVLDAVHRHTRTAVPAGFGVGKTWLAGRLVAWAGSVNPAGTMVIVTTATRFRQVRNQLWPHIRKVVARAQLPGACDTTQWKIPDAYGNDVIVAYGFTAPPDDEAAMQGIHGTPKLLLVVDEAGGIARTIGNGTNNLMTGDARMLAIGNPPANDPRSWFELLCDEGNNPEKASTVTIPITVLDSPAITGEPVPVCRDCPEQVERHPLSVHLPSMDWVDRTVGEYGEDHPYVVAKVYAKFPRDAGSKVIPLSWIEAAVDSDDPTGPGWHRLCDLGLEAETATATVREGAWVRLGVDVAADGGDELSVSRAVGDLVQHLWASSGSANADQVHVATEILKSIRDAERLAARLGSRHRVRVKVDKNGLGHGVVSMLIRWGEEGMHNAEIVGVMVSEGIDASRKLDDTAPMQPRRKRDEMWLAGRSLVMPDPATGTGRIRLRVDRKTQVQLSTPELAVDNAGLAVVESKKAMRARGVDSPDRAESALLCVYEPDPMRSRYGLLS